MSLNAANRLAVLAAAGLCLLLASGCAQSTLRISPDFGSAVHEDAAAQIADPDAHYTGTPAPGSAGTRAALAQDRYQKNQVVPPSTATASGSTIGGGGGGGGGQGGAPSGTSP
jgi:hypothetical protein